MQYISGFKASAAWTQRGTCLLLGVLFVLTSSLSSEAMGLMEIYRQAQQGDPILQSAHLHYMVAQEEQRQALAELLPSVTGGAAYTGTREDIISSDNSVYDVGRTDYGTRNYSLTLTQPLFRWGAVVGWKQSKIARLKVEAETVVIGQELIIRVSDLYFQALSSQDRLDYALAEQAAVSQHFELARGRQEMGLIPITDLHDAKARLAATQAQTILAQNQLDDALQALAEVTGAAVSDLLPLRTDIALSVPEPADLESWTAGALEQNPTIELQKKIVEIAALEVKRQTANHYPTLDLVGTFENEKTDGSLFGGGSEVESLEATLQLSVPLYQGGGISSRARAAKHELSIARQELVRQNRSVLRKARSAFLGVNSALSRVAALQQSVISNQLALDAKQEGFLSGLYTSLNVLDAERDLSLVSIDLAQARYDYILNSLKLKQAVGSLYEQDLEELEGWFIH